MTPSLALDWMRQMLWTAAISGAPIILTVAFIGLTLSVIQAATQINDAAVPFAAKAAGVFVVLTFLGTWMLTNMMDFTRRAFEAMATLTG
jgi:flagellar biosynthetic protein FliQ